jgi:hypothetical protein
VIGQHRRFLISFYGLTFNVHLDNVLHLTVELQNNLMAIDSDSGELKAQRSPTKHYRDRVKDSNNEDLRDSVTLFDWIQDWDWSKFRRRARALSRVINYFPRYSSDPESSSYEDYCRVKLMLHHPFEEWDDLLKVDGEVYGSYADAFSVCRVSTSTDGSSTRPRTARTAWIGASHCTTWYASRGNQYRTGTSSTLLKVANIVDFD